MCGRIAQLVEHVAYTDAVPGSSPGTPTDIFSDEYKTTKHTRSDLVCFVVLFMYL